MATKEKEAPEPEAKKRIFEIQTGGKNSYKSTIFLHHPGEGKKVELEINCVDGVIATEHEILAQHFTATFKYPYAVVKEKKGE